MSPITLHDDRIVQEIVIKAPAERTVRRDFQRGSEFLSESMKDFSKGTGREDCAVFFKFVQRSRTTS